MSPTPRGRRPRRGARRRRHAPHRHRDARAGAAVARPRFGWTLLVSIALHAVGLAALATLRDGSEPPPPAPPVEIVVVEPPARRPRRRHRSGSTSRRLGWSRPRSPRPRRARRSPRPDDGARSRSPRALAASRRRSPAHGPPRRLRRAWSRCGFAAPVPALKPGNGGVAGEPSAKVTSRRAMATRRGRRRQHGSGGRRRPRRCPARAPPA